ncbi:MAG: CoA-transferase subunit beta [Chloroflexi bacterium]|nr:CoA-transferase subunit beta [Chloroflexota bacterium]
MSTQTPLDYDPVDMMCIAAARELRNDDAVLVGMGPPLLACAVSKHIHAPGMTYVTESGPIDWVLEPEHQAPIQIAEAKLAEGASMLGDMIDALGVIVMGGRATAAVLQSAQIDRFGNMNTMVIGDYTRPQRRLPGTGGHADSGASAARVISTVPMERRRFKERVDFRTTAGYIEGPGGRTNAGLQPQGPNVCITTACIMTFDTTDGGESGTCEMMLVGLFPGVSIIDVTSQVQWDLRVSDNVHEIAPPTAEELEMLRLLDQNFVHRTPGRYR